MPKNKTRVVFRADGNSKIGLGHIVRLLAIVEMLPVGYEKMFLVSQPDSGLIKLITPSCDHLIVLERSKDYLQEAEFISTNYLQSQDIVVLDGYSFDDKYQESISRKGNQIVLISDYPQDKIIADVVINHAGGIIKNHYISNTYSRFYLGPDYAILRPPFLKNKKSFAVDNINRVLICFGGADPNNLTLNFYLMLRKAGFDGDVQLVVGAAYLYHDELIESVKTQAIITTNLSAEEMGNSISKADLVICPASSVSYEVGSLGQLMIAGTSADNQLNMYKFLTSEELAYGVGDLGKVTVSDLTKALEHFNIKKNQEDQLSSQKRVFDQNSKMRFRSIFEKLALIDKIQIRKVKEGDLQLLFRWANDPTSRSTAINPEPISLETHTKWFEGMLSASEQKYLYVFHLGGSPIGQIRFDQKDNHYLLSYSLDANYRGRGLGEILIRKGIKALTKEISKDPSICAIVRMDNIKSNKIFDKNHFILKEKREISGNIFCIYTRG